MEDIPLVVHSDWSNRKACPFTRGVPMPQGGLADANALRLRSDAGVDLPVQCRPLSRWPDGSLKWVLVDFQADVAAGQSRFWLSTGGVAVDPGSTVRIETGPEEFGIDTGSLHLRLDRRVFAPFSSVDFSSGEFSAGELGGRSEFKLGEGTATAGKRPDGDAWVRLHEGVTDGGTRRQLYGMGGMARASLGREEYRTVVEEEGPLRSVLRLEGAYEAEAPMHHYAGYRPCRFVTRLHFYAGHSFVRVLHTVIHTFNPRETEIEEIGWHVPLAADGQRRYQLGAHRHLAGDLSADEYLLLSQAEDNRFALERRCGVETTGLAEGERALGWAALESDGIGLGVALRHMPEEFPKALGLGHNGIDVFAWRHPEGKRLSLRRYAEEVAWHEGEGVYGDGTGTAKTCEFFVAFYDPKKTDAAVLLPGLLAPPHVAVEPVWASGCRVSGGFTAVDTARFPQAESLLTGFIAWQRGTILRERWYGYLDWGDMLATWEEEAGDWRFKGRWGWCNSEWDPRHAFWIQYLRGGKGRLYDLAEAMTRHSLDVDTCHWHAFRPYMVGGCFRHSLDHFGDEPCASHTFLDNWVDYYLLSGDGRTLEVLREAGEFLLRYRWSEDPAYSFSLRSIGNVLRGLLYLGELTGEARYYDRAVEVFEVLARGQNDDGSWHKRFQVSTPDRLPHQAPYGMATEGSTLAVEMGTAAPFTDDEYRALGGGFVELKRVLPYEEQKGYQTHYLMIGLEMLHRLHNDEKAKEVYLKAVDWFCGGPGIFDSGFALQHHYGGILCRHLAYAYSLSGEKGYLEVGRQILRHLVATQDQSDDPRRRGSVGMSPTYLSLLFFGVPPLLEQLAAAGMEEV
jgi:hypothetical protein